MCKTTQPTQLRQAKSPVDLYLIFEKSIWKNQVRRTGFLIYFELDFYCLCSLKKSISKIDFEIDFCRLKIQFLDLDFSNLIFQKPSTDQQGVRLEKPTGKPGGNERCTELRRQSIYWESKLLVPVACFADPLLTILWAVWAEQHATFT